MNQLLEWLAGGDLRSDGLSSEVVRFVQEHPDLLGDLVQGLLVKDNVIRGRAADALEHIGRTIPEAFLPYQHQIIDSLQHDPIPMVRWHLAMLMGHLALDWGDPEVAFKSLCDQLSDASVFVASWVIVSLCIYARIYPNLKDRIMDPIASLGSSSSVAIRSKVKKATLLLTDDIHPFPKGWIKSDKIARTITSRSRG